MIDMIECQHLDPVLWCANLDCIMDVCVRFCACFSAVGYRLHRYMENDIAQI